MEKHRSGEEKPRYQEVLRERVRERFGGLAPDDFEELLAFVKEVALESFKNGLAASRARGSRRGLTA